MMAPSGSSRTARKQWILNRMQFIEPHTQREESTSKLTRKELCDAAPLPTTPGSPESSSTETDSSSESDGSTQSEEPELDIPLTSSPVAESTTCERALTEVMESSLTPGGTDRSQRRPAKRKRKSRGGAVNERLVLMRAIAKGLERIAEKDAYISLCCKRYEHRMRMLPRRKFTRLAYEMDCVLNRFSQNQETD